MIDKYSFGNITIRGKEYQSDIIIYENSVNDAWWRRKGHHLCIEDLHEILDKKPEILIIGTGVYGLMKVPSNLIAALESKNMRVIVKKNKRSL